MPNLASEACVTPRVDVRPACPSTGSLCRGGHARVPSSRRSLHVAPVHSHREDHGTWLPPGLCLSPKCLSPSTPLPRAFFPRPRHMSGAWTRQTPLHSSSAWLPMSTGLLRRVTVAWSRVVSVSWREGQVVERCWAPKPHGRPLCALWWGGQSESYKGPAPGESWGCHTGSWEQLPTGPLQGPWKVPHWAAGKTQAGLDPAGSTQYWAGPRGQRGRMCGPQLKESPGQLTSCMGKWT